MASGQLLANGRIRISAVDATLDLSDEQRALRGTLREFADAEIAPHAAEWDRQAPFPRPRSESWASWASWGCRSPRQYGGLGAGTLSFAIALEELARVDSSVAITVAASVSLGGAPILDFGTEQQKQRWLVPLARGETHRRLCQHRAWHGLGRPGLSTTRRDRGRRVGHQRHQGVHHQRGYRAELVCHDHGDHGRAQPGTPRDQHVHRARSTPAGFVPQRPYDKMGWHASDTRELAYQDCRVPARGHARASAAPARGVFLATLDGGRIGVAAMGVGLAQGCLDHSVRWANQRCAFGQPIARYQAVVVRAGRAQDPHRRGARAGLPRGGAQRRRKSRHRSRPRKRNCSPASWRSTPPTWPCKSTAATATWKSRRSRGSIGMPRF